MKILITVRGFDTPHSHAVGNFELDQAKALRDAGHDVRIAAVDTRSPLHRRRWGVYTYELEGIPAYYASTPVGMLSRRLTKALRAYNAKKLWNIIEKSGWCPEIVHAHFGATLLPLARAKGIATVYTEHWSISNQTVLPEAELQRELSVYPLADRVLCVSDAQAESIRSHTGAEAEVVYNIVDTNTFRLREHIPDERFRFAAVGNAIRRKGYDLLLEAMEKLQEDGLNPLLTIIGDGDALESLRARSREAGLSECVRFLGNQPRSVIAEEFARADAFVLASRMETFGVVYIEAMAAGLPVIATRCGGPENFVTPETGLLIAPEDTAALADAMKQMMREREKYDAAAIAEYARSHFSPEVMAERLTGIYEEILK